MSVFSTNQVRQLYVVNAYKDDVTSADAAGTITVKADTAKNHMYFRYKGADNLTRSDLIDIKNISSAKATSATSMSHELKAVTVTLNKDINDGNPVVGQDYILRIAFRQYVGMSDEDQYFKYGVAHAYAGMKPSKFYEVLAESLAKNFSREVTPLVDIILTDHDTSKGSTTTTDVAVPVLKNGVVQKLPTLATGHEYTAIVIDEVEQPWRLGIMEQTPVYFTVQPSTITVSGDEVIWGITEDTDSAGTVNNGKKIADLEYFCMGERGDMYREKGWPNNIPTAYLVDPTKAYHTLDIHYSYIGSNESVQKSEKDITIVCSDNTELNKLISKINTATGLGISTL